MNIKKLLCLSLLVAVSAFTYAQQNVVMWKFSIEDKGKHEIELVARASIKPGWHLYDADIPEDGPFPATLSIENVKGAKAIGKFHSTGKKAITKFDPIFKMDVCFFENSATFVQRFKVTDKKNFELSGNVRAQACNNQNCTHPIPVPFSFKAADLKKSSR